MHHAELSTRSTHELDTLRCIRLCGECAAACQMCAHHCLHMGQYDGPDALDHASPRHQGVLRDCADACELAVRFMSRHSGYADDACTLCTELCLRCADHCEHLAMGDPTMIRCAECCRDCAEACEEMLGAA